MSMDSEDLKTAICPQCETLVETYAPGISCVRRDGLLYHPGCVSESDESEAAATNVVGTEPTLSENHSLD